MPDREYIHNPLQPSALQLEKQSLSEVLRIVCHEGQQLTSAAGAAVLFLEEDEKLKVALSAGKIAEHADLLLSAVWHHSGPPLPDKPLLYNDLHIAENDPAIDADVSSLLVAPLGPKNGTLGILVLVNSPGGFSEDDLRVVALFTDWAAVALERARLNEQYMRLAVVEERQRLARDLHDAVTQSLYAVTLYAEAAARLISDGNAPKAVENLAELRDTALSALREMRLLVFELRPHVLEEEGLVSIIQARLAAVEERVGLTTAFKCEEIGRLPDSIEKGLYGLAREALNNALKHAHATGIYVTLQLSDSSVILKIEDNGQGFDVEAGKRIGGLGLKGMDERARQMNAELLVTSQKGRGTQVRVEVPLHGEA